MSVDYMVCKRCSDPFPDSGDYEWCHGGGYECGIHWCSETCAKEDGLVRTKTNSTCSYCRGDKVEDSKLLDFALTELKVTKENLQKSYYKGKK